MKRVPASRTPAMGKLPAVCFLGVGPSVSAHWDEVVPSVRQVRSKSCRKDEGLGSDSWVRVVFDHLDTVVGKPGPAILF